MIIDAPTHADIPALCSLWKDTFGDTDAFLKDFFSTAFSSERSLCARIDGKIVGMLYWFDCSCEGKKIAYLYAVATHSAYRGRGICHALMEEAHHLLQSRGYAGVILVPAEDHLFDFYARMGYTVCSYNSTLECKADGQHLEMRPISSAEYAELRLRFLPHQSVLQEGENIAFLQTLASFWAGENFLLATRKDRDTLFGLELLGDVTLSPRITHTLGFDEGKFRIIGQDEPFAMFRPLGEAILSLPTYFAFAFD